MSSVPWLTLLLFLPWMGALVIGLSSGLTPAMRERLTLAYSLSTLLLSIVLLAGGTGGARVERYEWMRGLNVDYHLSADGVSLLMVLLCGLVAPASYLASSAEQRASRGYSGWFLALQGSAIGVFLAQDFVLWFLFWELSLVPAFFLVKGWGGKERSAAAYQFFTYTMVGSAFMLVAFAALYAVAGTMDFGELAALSREGVLAPTLGAAMPWVFVGVLLGVAVKAPLFPLHSWLPSTYREAPSGTTMFLSGVLSKMGVYGFVRILAPIFPVQLHAVAPILLGLAVAGALLGAFAALGQKDLKRMAAYCSLNHVSYCLMALFALYAGSAPAAVSQAAAAGLFLQMFNHGISAPALFLFVAVIETRSGGERDLNAFGGLRARAPWLAGLAGVAVFSSLGLPGLNGFVGEYLIFSGVMGHAAWAAFAAAPALLVTAIFLLRSYQAVFGGPVAGASFRVSDVTGRDRLLLAGFAAAMLVLGLAPQLVTSLVNPHILSWLGGMP
ncbi:MAG: NADH-quinone oxidoreductase subunit M [Opitutaceae bacterium]|nr:NADH-quinone oxidoreductase subunit M [Opitutaceae bacterium]